MSDIIGWDVGGAHLKAARVRDGRVIEALQLPCTLWQGMVHLDAAISGMRQRIGEAPRHAVTTTGELTDLFASRRQGVSDLAARMAQQLAPAAVSIYAGRRSFVSPDEAAAHAGDIASANWHASASLVAARMDEALFIDMGSTTTDLIPVQGGQVASAGYGDAERLAAGELVYTGLTRSFLMAECRHVPFCGRMVPLMNEYFANMADVYRVMGTLDQAHDQHATADGRDKSAQASRARLARMLGLDAEDAGEDGWLQVASWFAEQQLRRIDDASRLIASRLPQLASTPIVAAGVGRAVIEMLAMRLGRNCVSFEALLSIDAKHGDWVAACAPAAAVALLLEEQD